MPSTLHEFIADFVQPLLGGGALHVGRPIRPKDYRAMVAAIGSPGSVPDLEFLRLRRAQLVVADPELPEIDLDELGLWVALHNILALDHPDRERVWARVVSWRKVESVTRTLLTLGQASDFAVALARHVAVGPFIELRREDHVVVTLEGEERYAGQPVPGRRFLFSGDMSRAARTEVIEWLADRHMPEVERLIIDALWASPITCLLRPLQAPPGWTPLIAAPFLLQRGFARTVCHAWAASSDWIEAGGAVIGGLLYSLTGRSPQSPARSEPDQRETDDGPRALPPGGAIAALPGSTFGAGPREIGAVVGALVHVHFLKVLELGARLGLAASTRDRAVQLFLALPLVLPRIQHILGEPLPEAARVVGFDGQVARRWIEYRDHLAELIPQPVVENLVASLVPRIVKASTA
ncbi:MAG: hypothetical protein KC636_33885 [Myxococcales bacterium]|nr:hypothetical protein [Myxococcales bacterium]